MPFCRIWLVSRQWESRERTPSLPFWIRVEQLGAAMSCEQHSMGAQPEHISTAGRMTSLDVPYWTPRGTRMARPLHRRFTLGK